MNKNQNDGMGESNGFSLPHSIPALTKMEEINTQNLHQIVKILCHLINKMAKFMEAEEIEKSIIDELFQDKDISNLKQTNLQVKYYEKSLTDVSIEIDQILQQITKLKSKDIQLPRVKKGDLIAMNSGQLSTITQKESQENLLHNYLRKHSKKRSKTNLSKLYQYNTSSIDELEFEVIREQTRKSLDNPYHSNNQNRKILYNELERIKGQDTILPAVKNYLDKHKKHAGNGRGLPNYTIQKFI